MGPPRRGMRASREQATTLVAVLGVLALLSLTSVVLSRTVSVEARSAAAWLEGEEAVLAAEAGLARAMAEARSHALRFGHGALPLRVEGVLGGRLRYEAALADLSGRVHARGRGAGARRLLTNLGVVTGCSTQRIGDLLEGHVLFGPRDLSPLVGAADAARLAPHLAWTAWENPVTTSPSPRDRREPRAPVHLNAAGEEVLAACLLGLAGVLDGEEVSEPIPLGEATRIAEGLARRREERGTYAGAEDLRAALADLGVRHDRIALILANADPNAGLSGWNPDAAAWNPADRGSLTAWTTEFCYRPTGWLEVASTGAGPDGATARVLSTVQAFTLEGHLTQEDFHRARTDSRGVVSLPEPAPLGGEGPVAPATYAGALALDGPAPRSALFAAPAPAGPPSPLGTARLASVLHGGDRMADGVFLSRDRARTCAWQAGPVPPGATLYRRTGDALAPAAGAEASNLPMDRGTLELWVKFDRVPLPGEAAVLVFATNLDRAGADGVSGLHTAVWLEGDALVAERVYFSALSVPGEEPPEGPEADELVLPGGPAGGCPYGHGRQVRRCDLRPRRGEWHHLRLAWTDGADLSLAVDGESAPLAADDGPEAVFTSRLHAVSPTLHLGPMEGDPAQMADHREGAARRFVAGESPFPDATFWGLAVYPGPPAARARRYESRGAYFEGRFEAPRGARAGALSVVAHEPPGTRVRPVATGFDYRIEFEDASTQGRTSPVVEELTLAVVGEPRTAEYRRR